MSSDFAKALVDVRKAYRLLFMYQKNILSTIEKFSGEFDAEPCWWTPVHNYPPVQRSSNVFERSAWDLLPLYSTGFLFKKSGTHMENHEPGDWLLSLELMTDSEYEWDRAEPNPVNFEDAESSSSYLIASIFYCAKALESQHWYYGIWNNEEYPEDGVDAYTTERNIVVVKKDIDLHELENENAIGAEVNAFKQLLKDHLPNETW